ncbi:peptide chain release factor N(5)-glutamine methyltransferase [Rhizobiaceae bacterium n13]|uniref:Release factor glutamine methyltransferase n=1 Tax=Ferirhizobium litorale TaxID=2927786 RepID=A0AAE3QKA3_9HYPH|nr:peptide chain release factor N(5)-glutamine methyltransferase [Fererhizobium litorale]MDI7864247.1 peptide chain release factor N(5)-glutamine methyltransferase [Fererhizobium litorale]MDI7924648.1 peptide chain release factor N(5)-glutamine methyltransferase [Fererhizobium litorale]
MQETASAYVREARRRFQEAGIADAAFDARVLVAGILEFSGADLVLRGDDPVPGDVSARIKAAIERRLAREPVHRILGRRDFYGLELGLSSGTLEPRPDTELLVDRVLPHLKAIVSEKGSARVLDLGTGTGAICLALLHECPQATGVGADISADALSTARANAEKNGLGGRFEGVQSSWFEKIDGLYDVIVSNPPYIVTSVIETLEPEVRDFDPPAALDGGTDGLDAYRAIAAGAKQYLHSQGLVGLEIGYDQKDPVTAIFLSQGFNLLEEAKDLGGNDRVLLFCCNSSN